jgi:hypothetical protein
MQAFILGLNKLQTYQSWVTMTGISMHFFGRVWQGELSGKTPILCIEIVLTCMTNAPITQHNKVKLLPSHQISTNNRAGRDQYLRFGRTFRATSAVMNRTPSPFRLPLVPGFFLTRQPHPWR